MERREKIGNEATSKKTLEDLEENEESTAKFVNATLPSPDGEFAESGELKDADPV